MHRLFAGDLPLSEAFWTWAVGSGLAVNIVISLVFLTLVSNDQLLAAFIVGYGCSILYTILAFVGVWRAADRFDSDLALAGAARIIAAEGLFLLSVR